MTPEQAAALAVLDDARRQVAATPAGGSARRAAEVGARAAWEQVRLLLPEETVVVLDDVPRCETGAPLPVVVSDGHRTWVSYYVGVDDERAVLRFDLVDSCLFRGPNDEALHGHRLYGRGLAFYRFHEVIGSAWIAARERENSVHPEHRGGWHALLRHFILTFHDETFECIAQGYAVQDPDELPPPVALTLSMGYLTGS